MASPKVPATHVDILDKRCFASVATVRPDGHLSCNPVSVVWDGENVRFSSLSRTRKIRNLRADSRIALSILDPDDPTRYVELRGTAVVEADEDRAFVNQMARKYMDVDVYPYDPPDAKRMVVTVHVDQVSTPPVQGD